MKEMKSLLLCGTCCMFCLFILPCLTTLSAQPFEPNDVAGYCEGCHEEETKEWHSSPHARSINPEFLSEWKIQGKKWECLVCHASQFDRKSKKYSEEGVSCESCHGVLNEDHPDEARMILPVTSESCQDCHSVTYGEWRISAHGQKNIRCFDCHKMHRMELRKEDPDQMCGTCHAERLKDFAHATHRIKGLQCITCHMPEPVGVRTKMMGTGVRGHTFQVGAESCSNCHRDMVHGSHEISTLEEEVLRLEAIKPETLTVKVQNLEEEREKLRRSLLANRRVFPWIVILAFALGLSIGFAIFRVRWKRSAD